MDIKMKSPLILVVGVSVIFLSLAGGAFYLLQQERAKSASLLAQLEDIKTKHRITEAKLQESQKLAVSLESNLREVQTQIETLNNEVGQERAAKEEALANLKQVQEELSQQKGLRNDLENKYNQTQKNLEKLQSQVAELEGKKKELETKVKDAESQSDSKSQASGVELGKIVINPEASAEPAQQASEGQVLVVNKDYGFAVISLGLRDGVSVGDVYSVYHNEKYLGDLKVEKVHDSMSAAGFVATAVKEKVVEGDKVVLKGK